MDNNDCNRRIRYALQIDDTEACRLITLGSGKPGESVPEPAPESAPEPVTPALVAAWRLKEGDEGYRPCPDSAIISMLNGLVQDRRGPPPELKNAGGGSAATGVTTAAGIWNKAHAKKAEKMAEEQLTLSNNLILKQIRIALSLKSDEVHGLIEAGGGRLGKNEVGAFFRNPQARNFRRCGDQVLRWFLNGLASRRDTSVTESSS